LTRFNSACPNLPAAATPNARTVGTSITVTSMSGQSRSAPARRSRCGSMGLVVRLLSGEPSQGMHQRHRGHLRPGPGRFRGRVARAFLSKRTEADFEEWRHNRDWTARKYAMWERGERLPTQKPNSMMRCPCGEVFDSHRLEHTLIHVPHISAAESERAAR
jgi:hypothetical protein